METSFFLKLAISILSVTLIISVLLQSPKGGLGTVFGGSTGGEFYRSKRGLEGFLFKTTIFSAVSIVVLSVALALVGLSL